MPESALWSLLVAFIATAFALALKNADLRRTIKNLQKELDTARMENKPTQQPLNKSIPNVQKLNEGRNIENTETISTAHKKPLDVVAVGILLKLWKFPDGLTDKEISKILEADIQTVKYHLETMEQQNMIHGTLAAGHPRVWRLIQGGREYLIENKLNS